MLATVVFQQLWEALNEVDEDGNRLYRYIILEGSSRSSKTASVIQALDLLAQANEHWRICAYRNTKKDCRDTVLKDMHTYFRMGDPTERKFNRTEAYFTYPSGSTLEIHGAEDEVQTMGANKHVAFLNEPYKIAPAVFNQLDMRTKEVIILDWNPKEKHFIDDLKKNPRTKVLHSTFRLNPFCPREERIKILSYQPVIRTDVVLSGILTPKDAFEYNVQRNPMRFSQSRLKELLRCRDNEYLGTANDFFWQVYGLGIKGERPHRIFHFHEIPDDKYHQLDVPIYYGCDFGEVDPCALLEVKYYDGALYCHELNYASENEIRRNLSMTERMQVDGQEEGLIVWLMNKCGISRARDMVCDSARADKIRALRMAGYSVLPCVKGPGSIIDGIQLLNKMRVYYTKSSVNFANEQEMYSRKVDRYGNAEEEPEDLYNHALDNLRYVAQRLRVMGIINVV